MDQRRICVGPEVLTTPCSQGWKRTRVTFTAGRGIAAPRFTCFPPSELSTPLGSLLASSAATPTSRFVENDPAEFPENEWCDRGDGATNLEDKASSPDCGSSPSPIAGLGSSARQRLENATLFFCQSHATQRDSGYALTATSCAPSGLKAQHTNGCRAEPGGTRLESPAIEDRDEGRREEEPLAISVLLKPSKAMSCVSVRVFFGANVTPAPTRL
mmetsp:Transcript_22840/g.46760  ORF Transcript_22840/g.46760 Transcript_22840/m.46760 type:complete len:215 (+) Transcript_22840:253-897(+)